ncbi:flagellar biosynthesis anti-sigma factor FlgM [Pseudoalteromonas fenneropenaei]|uniref:Negative regulator of flagellin synthesis n=1 Tax=Pseudoalteromonas fenneropenaei TaxID=1737459 RepID=A0ABV7CGV2_9GAMM
MVNHINNGQSGTGVLNNAKQQKLDLQRQEANRSSAPQTPATPKAASDSVSLTPQAQQLKTVHEKAQQSSGFDSKKVEELKKAISEGKYQIDSEKLAKNIAAFEFNLYG